MKTLGVLLAGGASSRMGRDKALLPWSRTTLLDHQLCLLKSLQLDHVLVAGTRPGYNHVEDLTPHAGPLAALAHIARQLTVETRMLVVPVDMPLLRKEHVESLLEARGRLVAYEGHPLPLALTVDADTNGIIAARLRHGLKSLRGLWKDMGQVEWLVPPVNDFLANANTPEEWQHLMERTDTR